MTSRQQRTIKVIKKIWTFAPEEIACRCGVTDRASRNWLNQKVKMPATILSAIAGEILWRKHRPFPKRRRAGMR
jgi:hypothetical protein